MEIAILDGFALSDNEIDSKKIRFHLERCIILTGRMCMTKKKFWRASARPRWSLPTKVPMTASILAQAPSVHYIGVTATGYNIIDLEACHARNITVTNIPQYSTEAVAQFTFALLLEIASQVVLHTTLVRQGEWIKSPDFTFWKTPLMEIAGKTMGLIGFGAIGQAVAKIAQAFNLNVIFYNHRPKAAPAGVKQVTLAELYATADIISLHIPQFPETEKMINAQSLAQMKKTAIVINTKSWRVSR